ncbi:MULTISPECIES: DNA polymerase III subunit epsilon [Gilliamella]|uniref:DNA polymerase III subunit epsilon n=1 Tax=Gilliamella apis TaxID=1970738 RepID=A0A242P6A9_9GAMM|nr:DNA polymerase III subunit epsilon [Gilliamella apis]KES15468.1 DNA polymerase III, epsilon subunit or related 3'-5' exonuclease [Gilliamella apis SCGC AB-598-P17]MBI0060172.1 DNA polymerase III subunit epsilon [Gilliamella sp. M0320]MBI0153958.1 DNA polymerase III subunit epsilon [Gilliamella sp. W8128]MCT6884462.1 DNA polymerase III subunit epsilon [Gilliamella apis]OCF98424.1 DNA polymerase III subunit epsilon [Gilliamella apis]
MITHSTRQIVLDTETTGMNQDGNNHYEGHKIIEIGAVEVLNRRLTGNHFHVYINPERLIDEEAFKVHGISDEFVKDKPIFKNIAHDFIKFIDGAELVIHNASFDVGFMDYEFRLCGLDYKTADHCIVTDTLAMARRLFPGKRNNLDALCERYQIDNSHRTLHGALLDAEILAEVYLAMTGGQTTLAFSSDDNLSSSMTNNAVKKIERNGIPLTVIKANEAELSAHDSILEKIDKKSGGALWKEH